MRQRTTPWHMATLILPEPHLILSGKYRSTSCTYRVPLPFYECKGLDAGWKSLSKISRFYRGVLKIILKIAKQIQYLPKLFRNSENKYTTTEKLFYNSESKYTTHQITWPHYCNKQQIAVKTEFGVSSGQTIAANFYRQEIQYLLVEFRSFAGTFPSFVP